MKALGKISVFPKLPESIERLRELSYNLWWIWNPDAQLLFSRIDEALWTKANQNPVKFLRNVEQQQLERVATDQDYLALYGSVLSDFDAYMNPQPDGPQKTWFSDKYPDKQNETIAYFSAEFGLHEALPIYSGGLGVLSGDHCKEASDLGLPLVGVGFLYPQGYFTQRITANGDQEASYEKIDFAEVPATPAQDADGNPVLINVDLPGRTVYAKVWKIQVGRVPLYLMDTDVDRNAPQDRELSARLYGGDNEMRISQEFVLGIGGVRALRALGYEPTVWHMNEGHSAFLNLERIRELVQGHQVQSVALDGRLTFDQAMEVVRAGSIFTTHTPVPAGHDAFAYELVEKFFWQYWGQLGIDRQRFLDLAAHDQGWGTQFSMTVLAFRLSAYHNGVSELHGHVSRSMWSELWPGTPVEQTPIGYITNGVHTPTWLVPRLRNLYSRHLKEGWIDRSDDPATWKAIHDIPDEELWSAHQQCKAELVDFVRARLRKQTIRHGEGPKQVAEAGKLLNPDTLTLGFARRFATYKRATLIFRDIERLKKILNNPSRPVQLIFSGKAHPKDEPGKAFIQRIYELSKDSTFRGKIAFVENYDMNIARHLISGVDVWLNNPRRPFEASGTSGQKAALSGAPNFSVLDGWWREGYNGENGWAIGEEREFKDQDTQDEADALSLYNTLEDEIVPLFYDRDENGLPGMWLQKMKNAIVSCAPRFSMKRMVMEYTDELYVPAMKTARQYSTDGYSVAMEMAEWKHRIRQNWGSARVEAADTPPIQASVGEPVTLTARIWPGNLSESELVTEVVMGKQNEKGVIESPHTIAMERANEDQSEDGGIKYAGALKPANSGPLTVGIRLRPKHSNLIHPLELGLTHWAE